MLRPWGSGGLGSATRHSSSLSEPVSSVLRGKDCPNPPFSECAQRAGEVISEPLREHSTLEASPVRVTLFSVFTPLLRR